MMIPITHQQAVHEVKDSASGDFSFITLDTEKKKNTPINWTYSFALNDYACASYFHRPY